MLESISLKCVNCGADIDITTEMSDFACGYCGTAQTVERSGGTVSLKPSADGTLKVRASAHEAAEVAVERLKEELQVIESSLKRLEIKKQREIIKKSRTRPGNMGSFNFSLLDFDASDWNIVSLYPACFHHSDGHSFNPFQKNI
jgi:hypothetical protein